MQDKRRALVAGNWKMNGSKALLSDFAKVFANQSFKSVDVLLCPPFPYLDDMNIKNVKLGAQNLSVFSSGAHTGEVSASMLKECGCQYVIVGHSERRADNFETNQVVAAKVEAALNADITPILCVGESQDKREKGLHFKVIAEQLDAVIQQIGINKFTDLVIAYEPVWAIGTGKTASPQQAQEVHEFIRQHLASLNVDIATKMLILYGGSVKGSNAAELFGQADVDGGLIGGASLDPQEFLTICQAAKV